ncbi:MAG TPA: 1,2-phenylacetyl-CoA epoxidase subunit PaaC [Streptosporangiaceae bacterium]|nr:1,2-phenylacetyl-CoA epoxidase subunit PaaC [Streptosporangiaceae bacterium]
MSDEDEYGAYQALAGDSGDQRWAFGTGFTDPLEGITVPARGDDPPEPPGSSVPPGVDGAALAAYCLMLGDDALIYSHRLQQWVTRAPELEEETALANIALDLLGQARMLLARAASLTTPADDSGRGEDRLAFFRDEGEFRNVRLVERADADFAELAGRLLVFSAWRLALFEALTASADPVLAAVAAKGVKELTYHRDYAAQWVIRLGDGTDLSHAKMQAALAVVWPLVDELFTPHPVEAALAGVAAGGRALRAGVDAVLDTVLAAATLNRPEAVPLAGVAGRTGRDGVHTEAFGYVLAELQSVARADPDATW